MLGDADRLAQALRNLISNAIRHTPAGGQVTMRVGRSGEQVTIQVADTGSGIAPEDLPHVFDRFYRGDKSRSRRGGGAGLGLAITRQLVAAHGGQIEVASSPGLGTIVYHHAPDSDGSCGITGTTQYPFSLGSHCSQNGAMSCIDRSAGTLRRTQDACSASAVLVRHGGR